ncbi:MAG: FUSC family protein [Verrucomicrobia bacterium]|nr:FUSC family protein [Verrucomicrobiota bacterium]
MATSEIAAAQAAPRASRLRWDLAALNPFGDVRVRYGIKIGLAVVLAVWIAEVYRLQYPNWAALAVVVLMNSHYVGATASKALMRAIGTVIGALLGVWVVGDFGNTPWAFVFWVFVVVAIATYKFGQLASAAAPYAYFLAGNTLVAVATYGISTPGDVWHIALSRTLETLVGVVSATFVTGVIWPRYAREEFIQNAAEALSTVRLLLNAEARAYVGEAVDPGRVVDLRRVFSRQVMGLRALLLSGGRGSAYFRARLGNYQRFLVSLTHLFQAVLELQRRRAEERELLELVRPEVDRVIAVVDADLAAVGAPQWNIRALPPSELNAAFADLEAKVSALRDEGTFRRASNAAGQAFFGHFSTLRMIRDELGLLREISGELPRVRLPGPSKRKRHLVLPAIDPFWVRASIKGGISVCLAFLLLKWIHPPGANGLPLSAWVFSIFGRSFLNAGGTGDLRVFQKVFLTAVFGLPVVGLLWLIMPFLANYWAMNALLFVICYAFGYATARTQGVSFRMQITILSISSLVALNPQQPVAFSSVMNAYLGLVTGMALAAIVGRVLWPVLPQSLLCHNLILFFADLRGLLFESSPGQDFILSRTVLLPLEALRAVDSIVLPHCPTAERDRLGNFIRVAQPLGLQLSTLRQVRARSLPAGAEAILRPLLVALESIFGEFLTGLSDAFRRRTSKIEFPELDGPLAAVDSALIRIRDEGAVAQEDVKTVAHMLELVDRYHALGERMSQCRDHLRRLNLHRYLGDVAL